MPVGDGTYMGYMDTRWLNTPDAKSGAYARKSQNKRRKMQRMVGYGRKKRSGRR